MVKLVKDLVLALLNATLLLVAACLFLAWRLSVTVDGMVGTFASQIEVVGPLREDVQGMTGEIAALRADLAAIATQTGEAGSATLLAVQRRVDGIDARLTETGARLDDLMREPGLLIDRAIDRTIAGAADEFAGAVNGIRGCVPPGS